MVLDVDAVSAVATVIGTILAAGPTARYLVRLSRRHFLRVRLTHTLSILDALPNEPAFARARQVHESVAIYCARELADVELRWLRRRHRPTNRMIGAWLFQGAILVAGLFVFREVTGTSIGKTLLVAGICGGVALVSWGIDAVATSPEIDSLPSGPIIIDAHAADLLRQQTKRDRGTVPGTGRQGAATGSERQGASG